MPAASPAAIPPTAELPVAVLNPAATPSATPLATIVAACPAPKPKVPTVSAAANPGAAAAAPESTAAFV